jgi:UDP-3-0-acyl N-acetylglucosamine deacetylase
MLQQTLMHAINYTGIGLHSGKDVEMKLLPAKIDAGISFHIHTKKDVSVIKADPFAVTTTELATSLGNEKVHVSTVEHLLAALFALGIDNAECHVYGKEIPIMDGSALPITNLIKKAGIRSQYALRKVAKITRPFLFEANGKTINARPYDGFYVDYTIDFPHKAIGVQRLALEITPETFDEVASARTFGFMKEVEYLHSKNLALGGSLANAIVIGDEGVVNPEGLRFADEFVRHKILDFIGDMAMFGMPLQGAFEVRCSGHQHNNAFLREMYTHKDQYLRFEELIPEQRKADIPYLGLGTAMA